MKYEEPYIEIIKFEFKNNVLAVSRTENTFDNNRPPVEGGDDDFDWWG